MSNTNEEPPPLEYPTGATVPFPYPTPYLQQTALMDTLLQCLRQKEQQDEENQDKNDQKKKSQAAVMMLESPTGTGKSLSLACSAMSWLKYCEQRDLTVKPVEKEESTADDWWNAWVPQEQQQAEQKQQKTTVEARTALNKELDMWRNKLFGDAPTEERAQGRRENFVRSAVTTSKMAEGAAGRRGKRLKKKKKKTMEITKQKDFCVTDYNSDPEPVGLDDDSDNEDGDTEKTAADHSASTLLDGHRLAGITNPDASFSQQPAGVRKIIYAARTHSQLSQFVGELKRTAWGQTTRVVALGSRQLLCGNAALKRAHPTESALTEACLDLKDGTKSGGKRKKNTACGCPLLESKSAISTLGLHLLTTPSDIEDAARLGSASRTCAYYASRKALAAAEVVVLPYSMLLSKPTRQAIGLSLEGNLVVVDEAHNLPEAIRQLHSSTLSLPVIQAAIQQLTRYTQTYAQRLAGRNLMYLGQLAKVCKTFAKYLKSGGGGDKENHKNQQGNSSAQKNKRALQSTIEFLLELKLDNINLFKLNNYLRQSRLSQKLLGFTRAKDGEENQDEINTTGLSKHVSAMSIVQTFLEKLNLRGQEGKIVTAWPGDGSGSRGVQHPTLRYVLLQPASCFANVLEETHALALVGGTLAPFGHVAAELLVSDDKKSDINPQQSSLLQLAAQADTRFQAGQANNSSMSFVSPRFAAFTCDHVVPSSNVFVQCLSFGPGRQKMDFRHQSRMAGALTEGLGQTLLELSKTIPHGLVVFLPSYNYEAHLVRQWQQSGLYNQLNRNKKIFREPKSAQQLEATLKAYAKQAAATGREESDEAGNHGDDLNGGALLLSVIGGKMSEGINLSNSMARGVVVVGLPYPDITDPELQEKMATMTKHGVGGISGQAYYQNLCMRAVNQSVGRAIRHANDYAAIFLCDYRYSAQPKIWAGLPKWLRNAASSPPHSSSSNQGFAALSSDLQAFFRAKEEAK